MSSKYFSKICVENKLLKEIKPYAFKMRPLEVRDIKQMPKFRIPPAPT